MSKKRTSIWIDQWVLRDLKLMGVERDQPIGNVIEALVAFAKSGKHVNDPVFQRRWKALLDTAFANAGHRATIVGDPEAVGFEGGKGPDGDDLDEG